MKIFRELLQLLLLKNEMHYDSTIPFNMGADSSEQILDCIPLVFYIEERLEGEQETSLPGDTWIASTAVVRS